MVSEAMAVTFVATAVGIPIPSMLPHTPLVAALLLPMQPVSNVCSAAYEASSVAWARDQALRLYL